MFKTADTLDESQIQSALKYVIRDGVASQAMGILTGGAFLIAFAVKLGASNFVIGLLAAIGPLSQLLQLPAIVLVEKVRNRRLITVVAAGLSRICWLIIALSPFIFPAKIAIAVLLILLIAVSAFGAISGCSWNSWMRDLIPEKIMGTFFSKRMRIATGVGVVLSILAAVFLGRSEDRRRDGKSGSAAMNVHLSISRRYMGLHSRGHWPRGPLRHRRPRLYRGYFPYFFVA